MLVARDVVEVAVLGQPRQVRDRDVHQTAGHCRCAELAQHRERVVQVLERVLDDDELERGLSRNLLEQPVPLFHRGRGARPGLDPGGLPAVGGEHIEPAADPAAEVERAAGPLRELAFAASSA